MMVNDKGNVITSLKQIEVNQMVKVSLKDGVVNSKVISKEKING